MREACLPAPPVVTLCPAAPSDSTPPPPDLPLPAPPPLNSALATPPTTEAPADEDWEAELDALLKAMSTHAPAPARVEPQLDTPKPPPKMSRTQGFVWDVSEDDVRRRRAAAVGTPAWHARLDQASPPRAELEGSEAGGRANGDASGANGEGDGGGWEDALSAIARQANPPVPSHSADQSSLSRLIEAQQQVGHPIQALGGASQPVSTDWLDTLLSETASLAPPSEPASSVPIAATPASQSGNPASPPPWITVTRGAKQPGKNEKEKAGLFGPLVEAIKVVSEQTGQRRVTRGLVGSELHPTGKAKAKFYAGMQGIETFRDCEYSSPPLIGN